MKQENKLVAVGHPPLRVPTALALSFRYGRPLAKERCPAPMRQAKSLLVPEEVDAPW
jgi:hypothetical protein